MSLIEKLTPEQEALIPVYREKWRAIALSTERIDREKAAEAVKVILNCLSAFNTFKVVIATDDRSNFLSRDRYEFDCYLPLI
ncbi:MAG: hypothetical protein RMY29_000355 [Nostoc sp. CreGUA01]|nr:hypothetical protein [Nostoc sp. CreGUA01]